MELHTNYSLQKLNTFGFDIQCKYFAAPHTEAELLEALTLARRMAYPLLIMGGGSNLLFTGDFEGLVVQPQMQGIEVVQEDDTTLLLRVGAGVIWDDLVAHCVQQGYYGVENLSLIPGHVGASPVQNIGAYGVEAKDSIAHVEYICLDSLEKHTLSNQACNFGYRDSVFKHELRGKVVITYVTFALRKSGELKLDYGNIREQLQGNITPSLGELREAIIAIREAKLPNPEVIGNAGSFFKNPTITAAHAERLKAQYPGMPSYPSNDNSVKIPAGWLIETLGLKGIKVGAVGVHAQQALVLVHYGGGKGQEILSLAKQIQKKIREQFDIALEMEVNVV